MEAKSKAIFINSIADGQKIPCPSCNALNEAGDLFCFSCGSKLMPIVAGEEACGAILCSSCNTLNESDSLFCISCGAKLIKDDENHSAEIVKDSVNEEDIAAPKLAFTPVKRPTVGNKSKEMVDKNSVNPLQAEKKPVFRSIEIMPAIEEEAISVFAQGLPSWNIVPPQVMVRRKKK